MNTIQSLKKSGMSLDVIAEAGALTYSSVANVAEGADPKAHILSSALEKLKRLEHVMENTKPINGVKSGDFFEKHILYRTLEDGRIEWVYLATLWSSAIISDEELSVIMKEPLVTIEKLSKTSGVSLEDLVLAEPTSYMSYRKSLVH